MAKRLREAAPWGESPGSPVNNLDDGCLMHILSFLSPIPGSIRSPPPITGEMIREESVDVVSCVINFGFGRRVGGEGRRMCQKMEFDLLLWAARCGSGVIRCIEH